MLIHRVLIPIEAFQTNSTASMRLGIPGQNLLHPGPGHVCAVIRHKRERDFGLLESAREGRLGAVAQAELCSSFDEGQV